MKSMSELVKTDGSLTLIESNAQQASNPDEAAVIRLWGQVVKQCLKGDDFYCDFKPTGPVGRWVEMIQPLHKALSLSNFYEAGCEFRCAWGLLDGALTEDGYSSCLFYYSWFGQKEP